MKKLLSILSIALIGLAPLSSVVSCAKKYYKDIFVITDSGKVTDNSFNQSSYEGANFFVKKGLGINMDSAYIEPKKGDTTNLTSAYINLATNIKPKAVVLSGYIHTVPFGGNNFYDDLFAKSGIAGVQIDSSTGGSSTVGIRYYKDSAGFVAGFESIIWSIENENTTGSDLSLATYGGQIGGSQFAVTNYMEGFLAAIDFFNGMKNEEANYKEVKDKFLENIKNEKVNQWLKKDSKYKVKRVQDTPQSDTDPGWVSGSYAAGGGKDISNTLISHDANVIFPVAGPQSADTLGQIAQKPGKKIKIIGVDTDMSKVYPTFSNDIITSATIPLSEGAAIGIAHTKAYIDNKNAVDNIIKDLKEKQIVISPDEKDKDEKDKYSETDRNTVWQGHDVWLSGTITTGDSSKLDPKEESFISNDFLKSIYVTRGSEYFIENGNLDSYKLLSPEFTKAYSDIIAKSFSQK